MAGYREFQTGEVLTAGNVNDFLMNQAVMVFADDAARTTALAGVLAEGMLTYNLDTQALEVYDGTSFVAVGGAMKEKRIEAFTGSGTFTVPAGVTYAIAYMQGGGGGIGLLDTGGNGSPSSVAFSSGTVTGAGTPRSMVARYTPTHSEAGLPNSGTSATAVDGGRADRGAASSASTAPYTVAAAPVTPGSTIAVVVGNGGTAGTGGAAGGSGYVYIEYFEEV